MFGLGKRKKVTEETVTWSPPDTSVNQLDEFALCEHCQFKGKCQFFNGCKTFQQIKKNREERSFEQRGIRLNEGDRDPHVNYMHSVSWKDRLSRNQCALAKIVHIEGVLATVVVTIKNDNDRSDRGIRTEIQVPIPLVVNSRGHEVANFQQLRSDVRKQINAFNR